MTLKQVDSSVFQKELPISENDLKLQTNYKLLIVGASGAGKTQFICELIKERKKFMVDQFDCIIYNIPKNVSHLHSVETTIDKLYQIYPDLCVIEGLLTDLENICASNHILLIFDDLFDQIVNSKNFSTLCTFGSRHNNASMIITSQNYYESGTYSLTIKRQMNYILLHYPHQDKQILNTIGRSFFSNNTKILIHCFKKLMKQTTNPYQLYLFIDLYPSSPLPNSLRIRSNFFSDEPWFFVYHD